MRLMMCLNHGGGRFCRRTFNIGQLRFSPRPDFNQFVLPGKMEFMLEAEPLRFVQSKVTEGRSFCPD